MNVHKYPQQKLINTFEKDIENKTILVQHFYAMEPKNISSKLKQPSANRTKKRQAPALSASAKAQIWAAFDNDVKEKSKSETETSLTCVYDNTQNMPKTTDICADCETPLTIMEDGFPTCKSCGWFSRDILDYSPEWRFYGADDKNSNVIPLILYCKNHRLAVKSFTTTSRHMKCAELADGPSGNRCPIKKNHYTMNLCILAQWRKMVAYPSCV
jgi:hypothetical protein